MDPTQTLSLSPHTRRELYTNKIVSSQVPIYKIRRIFTFSKGSGFPFFVKEKNMLHLEGKATPHLTD